MGSIFKEIKKGMTCVRGFRKSYTIHTFEAAVIYSGGFLQPEPRQSNHMSKEILLYPKILFYYNCKYCL